MIRPPPHSTPLSSSPASALSQRQSFDVVVANEMKHLLLEMKEEHILIFSTHILQLARDLCDEIVLLHNGVLEQLGHDLLQQNDFEDRIVSLLQEEVKHAE